MVIDYFNGCTCARSLGIAAQIKIMGEPSLVFSVHWFNFIRLPSEKYKIMSWKRKEFEYLRDLLVSFKLYVVIAGDSLCISTMYYLLLGIYVILIVKKKITKNEIQLLTGFEAWT
jgi:hypothetical protein